MRRHLPPVAPAHRPAASWRGRGRLGEGSALCGCPDRPVIPRKPAGPGKITEVDSPWAKLPCSRLYVVRATSDELVAAFPNDKRTPKCKNSISTCRADHHCIRTRPAAGNSPGDCHRPSRCHGVQHRGSEKQSPKREWADVDERSRSADARSAGNPFAVWSPDSNRVEVRRAELLWQPYRPNGCVRFWRSGGGV